MMDSEEELKKFLGELKDGDIIFKKHFYDKIADRPYLNEKLIRDTLKDTDNLMGFQNQKVKGEERYKLSFQLSGKYILIIIALIKGKTLYIITSWKSNRKWQKSIQK